MSQWMRVNCRLEIVFYFLSEFLRINNPLKYLLLWKMLYEFMSISFTCWLYFVGWSVGITIWNFWLSLSCSSLQMTLTMSGADDSKKSKDQNQEQNKDHSKEQSKAEKSDDGQKTGPRFARCWQTCLPHSAPAWFFWLGQSLCYCP